MPTNHGELPRPQSSKPQRKTANRRFAVSREAVTSDAVTSEAVTSEAVTSEAVTSETLKSQAEENKAIPPQRAWLPAWRQPSLRAAHHHFVFQLMLDFKMSLRDYLHHHFVDGATLAQMAGISIARLNALVDSAAVPAPSYLVVGRSITSAVFGSIDDIDADAGRYFRPENLRWLRIATQAPQGFERQAVVNCLSQELLDAFTMAGISGEAAAAKVASFLPHFFNGTFALCAANPANGYAIARKELLQERLSSFTNNGANAHPAGVSQAELQQLIDDFAAACMPFSPAEYGRSSRKRLVDDLRLKLQPAAA